MLPISLCCLLIGAGISAPFIAIQSSVAYWSMQYGKESFIWLNVAIYITSFPMSLLILWLNRRQMDSCTTEEQKFFIDVRRLSVSLASMLVLLLCIPLTSCLLQLLAVTVLIGILSHFSLGVAFQLIMKRSQTGSLETALTSGYQLSSMITLGIELWAGLKPASSLGAVWRFFAVCSLFLCLSMFSTYEYYRKGVPDIKLITQDEGNAALLESEDDPGRNDVPLGLYQPNSLNTWREVFFEISDAFLALFFTIFGSIIIFPYYSYAPAAANTQMDSAMLSRTLFYSKNISDLIARPMSLVLHGFEKPRILLMLSIFRLFYVPFYLIYCFTSWIPRNDFLLSLSICAYAFCSGYFITSSYRIVSRKYETPQTSQIASTLMNLAFQLGTELGLVTAILIYFIQS